MNLLFALLITFTSVKADRTAHNVALNYVDYNGNVSLVIKQPYSVAADEVVQDETSGKVYYQGNVTLFIGMTRYTADQLALTETSKGIALSADKLRQHIDQ